MKTTSRGFQIHKFTDFNGEECLLQISSIATDDCIWLGCRHANPKVFIPGEGWQPLEVPERTLFNTRMHLSREQVAELLPYLQRFVETGYLGD